MKKLYQPVGHTLTRSSKFSMVQKTPAAWHKLQSFEFFQLGEGAGGNTSQLVVVQEPAKRNIFQNDLRILYCPARIVEFFLNSFYFLLDGG